MKTPYLHIVSCFVILFSVWASSAFAQSGKDDEQSSIEFAPNKDIPFLTYKVKGGRRPLRGATQTPRLQIWPSGKMVCATLGADSFETELSQEDVKKLVSDLVVDKKIYDLSAETIQKAIEKTGEKVYFQNGPSSNIEINLQRGKHVLDIVSADLTLLKFPEMKEMKRAKEIERTLEQAMAKAMLGGERQQKKALKKINAALKAEHAKKYEPFKSEDVKFANRLKGGTTRLTLEKIVEDKETKSSSRLIGKYTKDADGKESVSTSIWGMRK